MKPNIFIALDLETTGLDFEHDEIIEVAMVRFENGVMGESKDFLVKPKQELRHFIQMLTGIAPEDLSSAPDFGSVAGEVRAFIGENPIVAHNALFDSTFLKNAFGNVGVSIDDVPVFDSLTLSRIAFHEVPNHKLETLVKALGIVREKAHRALPDAEACGKVFLKAFEEIDKFSAFEKHELHRSAAGSVWAAVFDDCACDHESLVPAISEDVPAPEVDKKARIPRIREFFGADGILAKKIPGFAIRASQTDYAEVVERNMYKGGLAVLEAGTGTGKTLGYLVPAAIRAMAGERVIISTATRTLQEQLSRHDFPLIAPLFGGAVSAMILKGRSNYICFRKFQEHLDAPELLLAPEERDSFMTLIPWVERTATGDGSENSGFNLNRNKILWQKISSDAATCTGERCPFYGHCPALLAKKRAAKSNLIFVNHALFLSDLSLDFALLPAYDHIVFDEAHRLPALSHAAFGRTVRFFRLRNIVKALVHMKSPDKGLVAEIENKLKSMPDAPADALTLCENIRGGLSESEKQLHRFFLKMGKKLGKHKDLGFRYTQGILAEFDSDPAPVIAALESLRGTIEKLCTELREGSLGNFVRNLEGAGSELQHFQDDFAFITQGNREDWVFYLEEPFNPHTVIMHAVPLEPGNLWAEKFYPWIKSATFTSATLSVQGTFSYFTSRMGMTEATLPKGKIPFERIYEPPFDVNARRTVLIADFLPKPSDPAFQAKLEELLCAILPENKRNTLALFTSIASMTKAHAALSPLFAEKKKSLLAQHIDGGMDNLVELFRKERESCLLGCQGFWEGIDLPGDALEFLVIPKLPFPMPGDPLIASRSEKIKAAGGNSFKSLFVPEAVLELRQGMGRLIRSENDSGVLLLLDNRLITEAYGKSFTRLWANKHTVVKSLDELKEKLGLSA